MVLMCPICRSTEALIRRTLRGAVKQLAALIVVLAGSGLFGFAPSPAYAVDFSLNFQPSQPPGWNDLTGVCPFAGSGSCAGGQIGNGDPTPFTMVLQTIGGVTYYQTIVGDPASGFAQESYTQWAPGPNSSATITSNPTDTSLGDSSPDSGGNERAFIGNPSSSTTDCTATPDQCTNGVKNGPVNSPSNTFMQVQTSLGNPLAGQHVSGSGTGDPTKTVFHMSMTSASGDMSMDVIKPFLDKKPKVSQTVQDGGMSSSFVADMTGISYSDKNTPAKIVNNLTLSSSGLPSGASANFDMSLAQHPDVTAGRFTYTPGTGWNNPDGWDATNSQYDPGTYDYFGGSGFNPLTVDWAANFNYDENALSCSRASATGTSRNTLGNPSGSSCPGGP